MTHSPTDCTTPGGSDSGAGSATGVLMALVPCTADVAVRIIDAAARTAGVAVEDVVRALAGRRGRISGSHTAGGPVEAAVRCEVERARTVPADPAGPVLLPSPFVLRQHVNHLRAARRRTLALPEDLAQRVELENSLYTLCVLTGRRSAHAALLAAEEYLAANRLPSAVGPA
ncbi:DUF5133 domain-containing protein [Streptomyces xanthophaeus]|uniref:DUF5133 domain-containing protein n=1 Tax=Streptomyces xanthophaeus TaxID=67385 RepID=UPI0037185D87